MKDSLDDFEKALSGGHPSSLGGTIEVFNAVLRDHSRLDDLFNCYFSKDQIVRLRTSNAMKRIIAARPDWLAPYIDRFLTDIAAIDQPSVQWSSAQLFARLAPAMSPRQLKHAKTILKRNLAEYQDWIVLNMTMDTLGHWAQEDKSLRKWLIPHLERLCEDARKSVAAKARKTLNMLRNHAV